MKDIDDIFARLQPGGGYESLLQINTWQELDNNYFVGRHLGSYQLAEFIAQGGMSQIYLAQRSDGAISRDVAIKISPNSGMSHGFRDRFLREQQVLASLNHEFISRLYDVGFTEEGFPYIVMEWIDGSPVDVYCREQNLALTARLKLVMNVARAVQFAHAHLIVHRDIKPSNILVDGNGVPKLLDFGIAKMLQAGQGDNLTEHLTPLTPDFASPEQLIGGVISTASDIFQLGALLHLLVTGESLYGDKPVDLISLAPNHRDLDLPALRRAAVPGDLAAIIRKSVRHNPADRYADVSLLIEDLNAYLGGYPVAAAKGAQLYRMGKFFRRHQLPVLFGAGFVTLLVAGSVLYTINLANARDLAERQVQTSGRLLSAMSELIADTYSELLETRNERLPAGDIGNEPLRLLLERTNRLIDNTLVNEDVLKAELLRLQGATNRQLSQQSVAEEKLDAALSLARQSEDISLQVQIFTEMILLHTAFTVFDRAQSVVDEAFLLARSLPQDALQLAALHDAAATMFTRQDQFDQAREHIQAAIAVYENNPAADPLDLAGSYAQLGTLHGRQEQAMEQRLMLGKALEIYQQHESPNYRGLNMVYGGIAWSHAVMGEYSEAAEYFRKSLAVAQANFGDNHPTSLSAHSNLGIALRRQGDLEGALQHLDLALEAARDMGDTEQMLAPLLNTGNVYQDLGDLDAAQAAFEEGLQQTAQLEQMPGDKAFFLNNLGSVLLNKGEFDRGVELLRAALAIKQDVFGTGSLTAARTMLSLVEGQISAVRDTDAQALLDSAREIYVQQFGQAHDMFLAYELTAGRYALSQGRYDDAQDILSRGLSRLVAENPDRLDKQTLHFRHTLARLYIKTNNQAAVLMILQQADSAVNVLETHQMESVEHGLLTLEANAVSCNVLEMDLIKVEDQVAEHFPTRQDWRARLTGIRGACNV